MPPALRLSLDVDLPPGAAFDRLVDELTSPLAKLGLDLTGGPEGGVREQGAQIATITEWDPGRRVRLRWHMASWDPAGFIEAEMRVDSAERGSRITLELRGLGDVLGGAEETMGWFAGEVMTSLMGAISPAAFGDWFTDRYARRPSGTQSRNTYADPLYHYPNFRAILDELALKPDDRLLEVGCGGGAMLKLALQSGCRAAAIDHSLEMVTVARQANAGAIGDGRLEILEARADALPFADRVFTCATMTGVLGFLSDPIATFAEILRVLKPGGRFVGSGSDPELRGTPGAPEPMASRLYFYDDAELARLGREAGFTDVRVLRRDLEAFARDAGVPEEHLPLFASKPGEGARFIVARRGAGV